MNQKIKKEEAYNEPYFHFNGIKVPNQHYFTQITLRKEGEVT